MGIFLRCCRIYIVAIEWTYDSMISNRKNHAPRAREIPPTKIRIEAKGPDAKANKPIPIRVNPAKNKTIPKTVKSIDQKSKILSLSFQRLRCFLNLAGRLGALAAGRLVWAIAALAGVRAALCPRLGRASNTEHRIKKLIGFITGDRW